MLTSQDYILSLLLQANTTRYNGRHSFDPQALKLRKEWISEKANETKEKFDHHLQEESPFVTLKTDNSDLKDQIFQKLEETFKINERAYPCKQIQSFMATKKKEQLQGSFAFLIKSNIFETAFRIEEDQQGDVFTRSHARLLRTWYTKLSTEKITPKFHGLRLYQCQKKKTKTLVEKWDAYDQDLYAYLTTTVEKSSAKFLMQLHESWAENLIALFRKLYLVSRNYEKLTKNTRIVFFDLKFSNVVIKKTEPYDIRLIDLSIDNELTIIAPFKKNIKTYPIDEEVAARMMYLFMVCNSIDYLKLSETYRFMSYKLFPENLFFRYLPPNFTNDIKNEPFTTWFPRGVKWLTREHLDANAKKKSQNPPFWITLHYTSSSKQFTHRPWYKDDPDLYFYLILAQHLRHRDMVQPWTSENYLNFLKVYQHVSQTREKKSLESYKGTGNLKEIKETLENIFNNDALEFHSNLEFEEFLSTQ